MEIYLIITAFTILFISVIFIFHWLYQLTKMLEHLIRLLERLILRLFSMEEGRKDVKND